MSREQPQRFSGLRLDELLRNLTIPFFCWSNPPLPCWLIAHTCWIPAVHYSPFKQPNIEGNIITTRYIITIRWHHIWYGYVIYKTAVEYWIVTSQLEYIQNIPICSMFGIFTKICPKNHPNVGKYTIHGAYGIDLQYPLLLLNDIQFLFFPNPPGTTFDPVQAVTRRRCSPRRGKPLYIYSKHLIAIYMIYIHIYVHVNEHTCLCCIMFIYTYIIICI